MIGTYRTAPLVPGAPVVLRQDVGRTAGDHLPAEIVESPGNAGTLVLRTPGSGTGEPFTASLFAVVAHADYPHEPGYLAGCHACELVCHCADGTCVRCGYDRDAYAAEVAAEARWHERAANPYADHYDALSAAESAEERFYGDFDGDRW